MFFPDQGHRHIVDIGARCPGDDQAIHRFQGVVGIVVLQSGISAPAPGLQCGKGIPIHIAAGGIGGAVCAVAAHREHRRVQPGNGRRSRKGQLLISSAKPFARQVNDGLAACDVGQLFSLLRVGPDDGAKEAARLLGFTAELVGQQDGLIAKLPAGGSGGGHKPPRSHDAAEAPRKGKAGGKKSGKKGGDGKGGKKKKRIRWWQILLITLLVIALIFGGAFALIMGAITPEGGNIKLNQLINTPKEFQGKEFNVLVTGVDRSSTGALAAGSANDSNVNDGMTDMILYVHFNNETGEMKMLQIPRDTMVTTDTSVSGNYRINGVAKTQGSDSNNNMAALCELVADQYQIHIDGFITIRLEMLTELVDLFGGVEIYVPMEMDYEGSHLNQGYQTLKGDACEFLLRARHIYPDGDIGRLNMQRQFYAALFRKLKSIGNIWDVAKLTPAVLNYMETNLSASELVSFAISMLKIDSSKIMICQMPVISGPQYNGQSLLYPARQADADLLNQYFRENTGPVDASQLNLCDNVIDLSGYTATDPNIQQMGGLMAAADDAQKNENLDGSNQVTDIMASESTAESESTGTDSTDTESQPAA